MRSFLQYRERITEIIRDNPNLCPEDMNALIEISDAFLELEKEYAASVDGKLTDFSFNTNKTSSNW